MIRAFQWDLARQVERLDFLLAQLPRYAEWGYNELYLHLEDAVAYPSLPGVARADAYTTREFEKLGIDYCCGGRRTLDQACAEAKLPVEQVLERLRKSAESASRESSTEDWQNASLKVMSSPLVDPYIISQYNCNSQSAAGNYNRKYPGYSLYQRSGDSTPGNTCRRIVERRRCIGHQLYTTINCGRYLYINLHVYQCSRLHGYSY